MSRGTEDVLQEELWSWLSNQGYEVAGEVGVENGAIDLVANDDTEYIGFELKTVYGLESRSGISLRKAALALKQMQKYIRSSNLDRLYFCCESPRRIKKRMLTAKNSSIYQFDESNNLLNKLGLMQVSLAEKADIGIIENADKLNRTKTPELSKNNEAWVNHHVWKWAQESDRAVTREGFLPGDYYIDISIFKGSSDTTEILENQDLYSHVGIESKGTGGLTSRDELRSQLNNYIESGGLTHLYLAVPKKSREEIDPQIGQQTLTSEESLDIPENVGIITVDENGEVQIRREPKNIEMTYDGIRWSDSEYVPVGWGSRNKRQKETFNNLSRWYYQNHTLY